MLSTDDDGGCGSTFAGEGGDGNAWVTKFDEGGGALLQTLPSHQDVFGTNVAVHQTLVLLCVGRGRVRRREKG